MKTLISLSDDFDEWEALGFKVCKSVGLNPDSIVPLDDGTFILAFDSKVSTPQEQKLIHAFRNAKHLAWKFENLELDKDDYLGLGSKYTCFRVTYRK